MDAVEGKHTSQPNYDTRHGSPYDRGSADAWYRRPFNPHYFVGDSYSTPRIWLPAILFCSTLMPKARS